MITLNIREKGHLIEMPGIPTFRTPAKIDISKGDIRSIVGYLNVCDITDYEIVASNDGATEVYKAKDFSPVKTKVITKVKQAKPDKKLGKRMDRLEIMIEKLCEKPVDDSTKNVEQTTNQINQFQKQMLEAIKNIKPGGSNEGNKQVKKSEDDVEPFIPEIDISDMKLRGESDHKTVKRDKGGDDAADALSKLLK